ncbi:MAG: hypothetical protein DYG89_17370 [Caldilinea sp. CFX5]|nr:hypothetical protein [Caldilinea sp. CFX5]
MINTFTKSSGVTRLLLLILALGAGIACSNNQRTSEQSAGHTALGAIPAAPVVGKRAVEVTAANWRTWTAAGAPWQVDWSTLRMNINEEGQPLAAGEVEAPGNERYLINAPDALNGWGDGPAQRMNFFTWQRAYPLQTLPDAGMAAIYGQVSALTNVQAAAELPRWENIGPAPMRGSLMGKQKIDVSGRVLDIAVDPRNSNVVYVGAAQGGVWKSSDGGASWTPLTDNQPSLAIGALALDPNNPEVVYAGTGEPSLGGDNYYGAGLLKSTNGGQSWAVLGADRFGGTGIAKIIVDAINPETIYVANTRTGVDGPTLPPRGVFKSANGGQSWEALISCNDPSCMGATDLVLLKTNPPTLLAGLDGYGIARSTNGGVDWQLITNGLPSREQVFVQRVVLDSSAGNPSVVYASIHVGIPERYDGAVLFRSNDGGQSWAQVTIGAENYNFCGQQCWYSHEIAAHPTNPDQVLLGGMANYVDGGDTLERVNRIIVRVSNNGQALADLSPNTSSTTSLHPDMHVITFDPKNPQVIWAGNDGGVFQSTDGGATWQARNEGLATLQFTGFAVNPQNAQIIQGGMQDNNKAFTLDGGATRAWTAVDVGDGGNALIDPFNPGIWFGTRFGISFQRNDQGPTLTGYWPILTNGVDRRDRALFYMPIAFDPSTAGVFYLGTNRVYRTTDRGDNWVAISPNLSQGQGSVSTIAVAPGDPKTIWAGASDGSIAVTTNSGANWTDVTKAPLPNRFVSELAVAPNNPRLAYAVFNGFNTHTPGTPGHVFKTSDGGATWQDISGNLPDVPTLSLVLDRSAPGTIYIGTDAGVFRSIDDGVSWLPFNNGMPTVAVVDLAFNGGGNLLFAATHGRSVFRAVVADTPPAGAQRLYLPVIQRLQPGVPTPTPTQTEVPTVTPIPPATATATATSTPVTPEGTALPTLPATATPTNTPMPSPTRTPVTGATPTPTGTPTVNRFTDDFTNPNSGWPTGSGSQCASGYVDGNNDNQSDLYGVQVGVLDWKCLAAAPQQAPVNGLYAVTAFKGSANDGSVYGLVFGLNNPTISANSQFYVFWVDPLDQTYALEKYDRGTVSYLTGDANNAFVFSDAIAAGSAANRLRVRREGDRIDLFVNGFYVDTVVSSAFANHSYVGVANWSPYFANVTAYFDDFVINSVETVYQENYSDNSSGWAEGDITICQAAYGAGEYRTAAQADYYCLFRSPAAAQHNGRFTATMRREESFYQMAYGVLAGEDGNFSSFYALLVIPDTRSYALAKYTEAQGWLGLTWNTVDDTAWLYDDAIYSGLAQNELTLERDGDLFRIYINGQYLGAYLDNQPLPTGYYGLINWASQFEQALADFDNFKVVTWDAGGDGGQVVAAQSLRQAARQMSATDLQSMRRLEGVQKVE